MESDKSVDSIRRFFIDNKSLTVFRIHICFIWIRIQKAIDYGSSRDTDCAGFLISEDSEEKSQKILTLEVNFTDESDTNRKNHG